MVSEMLLQYSKINYLKIGSFLLVKRSVNRFSIENQLEKMGENAFQKKRKTQPRSHSQKVQRKEA